MRDEGAFLSDITFKINSGTLGVQAELVVSVWHSCCRNLKEALALLIRKKALRPMNSSEALRCSRRVCNTPALGVGRS